MKKTIILLFALFSIASFQKVHSQVGVSIDFNTFYTDMSPYGDWVDDPQYGHVWVNHEQGFRPYYTNGYCAYTRYGWTWVSDYPWGWAAFHYGRWKHSPRHGWVWIPGSEWAPAWVTWSGGGDYYGWAPLEPGWNASVSFNTVPVESWSFVPRRHMGDRSIHNYYEDNSRNTTIIHNNVTIINNYQTNNAVRYHAGPRRADVEKVTQTRIQPLEVKSSSTP